MEGTASSGYGTGAGALTGSKEPGSNAYWQADEYGTFYTEVLALIEEGNLQDRVEARVDDTGVIISFKDSALFEIGSAPLFFSSRSFLLGCSARCPSVSQCKSIKRIIRLPFRAPAFRRGAPSRMPCSSPVLP